MCGRYSRIADIRELQAYFGFVADELDAPPRYNIAPTQKALTLVAEGDARRATHMRWGLVPSWAKETSIGSRMINARAETVAEKPSFRTAFRRRRCLVLADGYYEWTRSGRAKRPMRIVMRSGEPFAFAGLWETWRGPDDNLLWSFTVITTEANEHVRPIHHRMPVILPGNAHAEWLDEGADPDALHGLLVPYGDCDLEAYEVSTLVNSYANDGPEVVARAPSPFI